MNLIFSLASNCYQCFPRKIRNSFQNIVLNQTQTEQVYEIEFSNGEVQKLRNFSFVNNNVNLINVKTIFIYLKKLLIQVENLIILTLLIIILCGDTYNFDSTESLIIFFSLGSFFTMIIISIVQVTLIGLERWKLQSQINSQKCTIFSKFPNKLDQFPKDFEQDSFENITWSNLQIGNIVCLQLNEKCPADLLILDSSSDLVLVHFDQRIPCSCTFVNNFQTNKGNITDFKTKLSGRITYTSKDQHISGQIKLKNDPRSTPFTKRNVIFRGENLDQTDWLFGIVIQVGNSCNDQLKYKWNFINRGWMKTLDRQIILICLLIIAILFVPFIIYYSYLNQDKFFYSSLNYSLLFIPSNMLWIKQIWVLYNLQQNNKTFYQFQDKRVSKIKQSNIIQRSEQNETQFTIIHENEKNVLLPIQKQFKLNTIPTNPQIQFMKIPKESVNFKGFLSLSPQNILDSIKTDFIVLENPTSYIKENPRVLTIINYKTQKKFQFNYEKLREIIGQNIPTQRQNFEKLLIDTNRQDIYNEQKTQDMDCLIQEKAIPELRRSDIVSSKLIKSQDKTDNQHQNLKQQITGPKKKSTRYLFDQSSFAKQAVRQDSIKDLNLINQSQNIMSPQSVASNKRQFSQFFKAGSYSKSINSSQGKNQDQISDRLLGDFFNEAEFLDELYKIDDKFHHEILIMLLITNNINSVYDNTTKLLKVNYGNQFDETLLEFCKIFQYQFLCCSQIENTKPEFIVKDYYKKVISIQNTVKVFDILTFIQPTEKRKNQFSILVRDPESFLLEEGSLLYSRIETTELSEKYKNTQSFITINDSLNELLWDGQKAFVYFKKQLNQKQTEEFLEKLSVLNETYGNRSDEIEKLFQSIEEDLEPIFCIGMKQYFQHDLLLSSNEFNCDALNEDRIFSTLSHHNVKTCIVTQQKYEDLILFIRSYQISGKEFLIHFCEKDIQQLQYKFRQHINYLLEEQDIFGNYQVHLEKYIIVNKSAFKHIMNDEYLKYHFLIFIRFSNGLSAYEFNSKLKAQLIKLIKKSDKRILCVGNSLDNNLLFKKSDVSFSIESSDNNYLISLAQPNYFVYSLKQLFRILFFYCPQLLANYIALIEQQLYRAIILAVSVYSMKFSFQDIDLFQYILFFIFPSTIFSCLYRQSLFSNFTTHRQRDHPACLKLFQSKKHEKIIQKIIPLIIISIFDSFLLLLSQYSILYQLYDQKNGKIDQTFQIIFFYISIELLEKGKLITLILDIKNNSNFIIRYILILIFMEIVLIICFIVSQSNVDQQYLANEFNIEGLITFIFLLFFILGTSFTFENAIRGYMIEFQSPYDIMILTNNANAIKTIQLNLNEDIKEYAREIKKIIESSFENRNLLDDEILKAIKGDQVVMEQMDTIHGFFDKGTEREYMDFFRSQDWAKNNLGFSFLFYDICTCVIYFYEIFHDNYQVSVLVVVSISTALQLGIFGIQYRFITNKKTLQILQAITFLIRYAFHLVINLLYIYKNREFTAFFIGILFILQFCLTNQPAMGVNAILLLIIVITTVNLISFGFSISFLNTLTTIFSLIKYFIILIIISYPIVLSIIKLQFLQRSAFVYQNRLNKEQKKISDILGLLMPRFIQERMNRGQIQISEDQGDVTVMFCDIYEFDKVLKSQQENLLDFLDLLYRAFDQLCQAYDLQKIETVGKTYMAAGGLKDYDVSLNQKTQNSTTRALEVAIKMFETIKTMKYGDNQDLKLKIGIHYGRVIAGVIGVHKPQFSLIGDTVNTTSRICSTGEPGHITLSESAFNNIKNTTKYQFEQIAVNAKGKGILQTFRLIYSIESKLTTQKQITEFTQLNLQKRKSVSINNKKQSILVRGSVIQPQFGGADAVKSPQLIIREIHQVMQQSTQMILKQKPIPEIEQEQITKSAQKSKSFNQHDQTIKQQSQITSIKKINETKFENTFNQKRTSQQDNILKEGQFISITQIQLPISDNKVGQPSQIMVSQSSQPGQLSQQNLNGQFIMSSDQLMKPGDDLKNSQVPRPQLKKKGTIVLGESIRRQNPNKSNTKILLPEERLEKEEKEKLQIIKIAGTDNDNIDSSKKLHNIRYQKSLRNFPESSGKRKSLEQDKLDEIEIPKCQQILSIQQKLDYQTLQNIKKFKIDYEDIYKFYPNSSYSNQQDQITYHSIYEEYKNMENVQIRNTLCFLSIIQIIINVLYFLIYKQVDESLLIVSICQCIFSIAITFIQVKFSDILSIIKIKFIILTYFIIMSVLSLIQIHYSGQTDYDCTLQFIFITSLMTNINFLQILSEIEKRYLLCIYFIILMFSIIFEQFILQLIIFTLGVLGIVYRLNNQEQQLLRQNYSVSQQLITQVAKYENMLQYLMPPHALRRLLYPQKDDQQIDILENVTVLFADIAGFTKYSSSVQPETVVEMLRTLFSTFDQYCQKAEIYKLFTIGDCYVCMGVIDTNHRDPAEEAQKVLAFGFSMIEIINHYNKDPQYQHLNMRIGVHTGRILGGVVGTDVVRYDIYGEDVTIANLMESSGTEGKVLVSEITKNLIENEYEGFQFEFAKDVYIPARRQMMATYFAYPSEVESFHEE